MLLKSKKVKVPGSCGELMQGRIDNNYFHVTCPINLYSEVEVNIDKNSKTTLEAYSVNHFISEYPNPCYYIDMKSCPNPYKNNKGIVCKEKDKYNHWKAKKAFEKTLEYYGVKNYGGRIKIKSQIPIAKGMASSTSDVAGVIVATSLALNKEIKEKEIAEIALSIEPTDGIIFKGICIFDHKFGKIYESVGNIPENKILIVDSGDEVDTIKFNKKNFDDILSDNEPEIKKALELLREGIQYKDIKKVANAATISALLNQEILFKNNLSKLIDFSLKNGALGVNIAHSGSVIGIIFKDDFNNIEEFVKNLKKELNYNFNYIVSKIINGGIIY